MARSAKQVAAQRKAAKASAAKRAKTVEPKATKRIAPRKPNVTQKAVPPAQRANPKTYERSKARFGAAFTESYANMPAKQKRHERIGGRAWAHREATGDWPAPGERPRGNGQLRSKEKLSSRIRKGLI